LNFANVTVVMGMAKLVCSVGYVYVPCNLSDIMLY